MSDSETAAAEVLIFHLFEARGGRRVTWWGLASTTDTLMGKVGEARASVVKRWVDKHGKPGKWVRISGWTSRPEAAAHLATYQGGI